MAALGGDPDTVEMPILQFVHLVEGGEAFAMSKRRGDFVTLDDLLDEIGVDATRYFMLQRSHDRTIELDVELARASSRARTPSTTSSTRTRGSPRCSAGSPRAGRRGAAPTRTGDSARWTPAERDLIKKLAAFPDEIAEAAERRAPHRIAGYALELAQEFTAFYETAGWSAPRPRRSSRSGSRCR